jgi:hypothetical protein
VALWLGWNNLIKSLVKFFSAFIDAKLPSGFRRNAGK